MTFIVVNAEWLGAICEKIVNFEEKNCQIFEKLDTWNLHSVNIFTYISKMVASIAKINYVLLICD